MKSHFISTLSFPSAAFTGKSDLTIESADHQIIDKAFVYFPVDDSADITFLTADVSVSIHLR